MTLDDAFDAGRAIGYLEAALHLLTLVVLVVLAIVAWAGWQWRQSRWKGTG